MRVAIYVRCAYAEESALAAQQASCLAYATDLEHRVVATFEDFGVGGLPNRGSGLAACLSDASAGEFEAIVVERSDRLSRDHMQFKNLLAQLAKSHVKLLCVKGWNEMVDLIGPMFASPRIMRRRGSSRAFPG